MANSDDDESVLDFHNQNMRKLDRWDGKQARILILDSNELTRLENADTYGDLEKLSVADNKLVRMYGICHLKNLQVLNLANNSILAMEGLRDLVHLKWLSLAGNKLKAIQHLKTNLQLTFLDFSRNSISALGSLSHLKCLKTLLLSNNEISSLDHASSLLPHSLEVLSVSYNVITDLNQISCLSGLPSLQQLFIGNNPCVEMTGGAAGFDYRSFVVNWCLGLKVLDGYVIGPKECLKAEWLYCQGKGRHFRPGEHAELTEYLAQVCPLTADSLQSEEDAKLTRILTKQRQHQQELLHGQVPSCKSAPLPNKSPSAVVADRMRPATACHAVSMSPHKKPNTANHNNHFAQGDHCTPMLLASESRYVPPPEAMPSPDLCPMSLSAYINRFEEPENHLDQMSKSTSAIPTIIVPPVDPAASRIPQRICATTDSPLLRRHTQLQRVKRTARPLSLSPSCRRRIPVVHVFNKSKQNQGSSSSDNESSDSEFTLSKLRRVREMAQLRLGITPDNAEETDQLSNKMAASDGMSNVTRTLHHAATLIQATWRGYWVRHHHHKAVNVRQEIRIRRAEDQVLMLRQELRKTKQEYDNEKRMRELQMEAIRALWKEVVLLQNMRSETNATDSGVDSSPAFPECNECVVVSKHTTEMVNFVEVPESKSSSEPREQCDSGSADDDGCSSGKRCSGRKKPTSLDLHSRSITPDGTPTTDMIQQLVSTCSSLQLQVQELQEALRTMSCFMFGSHVQRRLGESQRQMSTSSPYFSAVASPVTNPEVFPNVVNPRRSQLIVSNEGEVGVDEQPDASDGVIATNDCTNTASGKDDLMDTQSPPENK